eukprot:5941554-Karenia_brevis.AAC.1
MFDLYFFIDGIEGDPDTAKVPVTLTSTIDNVKAKLSEELFDEGDEDEQQLSFIFSYGGEVLED